MHKKWAKFCGAWKEKNTTPTESSKIKSWLDGEDLEDCRPCQTVCIAINDLDNAPYRLYNRYSVCINFSTLIHLAVQDEFVALMFLHLVYLLLTYILNTVCHR